MKTVKVFYAGIPKNTIEKEDVLRYFHGVPNGQSVEVRVSTMLRSAVMQGWVHANSGRTSCLMFRREIIRQQKLAGKHVLVIDSNLFLWRDPNNTHYLD